MHDIHDIIEKVDQHDRWSTELEEALGPHLRSDTVIARAVRCSCGAVGVGAIPARPYTWTSACGTYQVPGPGSTDCPAIAAWVEGPAAGRIRNANAALEAL